MVFHELDDRAIVALVEADAGDARVERFYQRLQPRGGCGDTGDAECDVRLYHLHIDPRFGQEDLDVVLPMRRLDELAREGVVGPPPDAHFSIMGYQLRPAVLENETAPAIVREMKARAVDAAALVPA